MTDKYVYRLLVLPLLSLFLCACESSSNSVPVLRASGFPKNIATIIEANCLGGNCHSQPTSLNHGLVLASWEAMTMGSNTVNDVIPHHARLSQIFLHVNTDPTIALSAFPRMPLARNPLTKEDQTAIFDWIEAGAPDESGRIPYSGATTRVYVANQGADYITHFDAATRRLIGAVKLSQNFAPISIVASPDKSKLYVASSSQSGIVKRFGVDSRISDAEFESQLIPSEILLLPDNTKGYLANYPSTTPRRFGVFDPVAMTMLKYIDTNIIVSPRAFALTTDANTLYVAGYASDNILRLSTQDDAVLTNIPLGSDVPSPVPGSYARKYGPHSIALAKDNSKLFVACVDKEEVSVIDLTEDSVIARIPTQAFPYGLALSPDGSELWVANTGANSVTIIDAVGLTHIATLDTIASQPRAITFSPDGSQVYIACQGLKGSSHHTGGPPPSSAIVIDRFTRKLLATIELPTFSVSIATDF